MKNFRHRRAHEPEQLGYHFVHINHNWGDLLPILMNEGGTSGLWQHEHEAQRRKRSDRTKRDAGDYDIGDPIPDHDRVFH
jgi:hypothetical protein